MSDEITTAMIDTFNDGIEMLAQQMSSKLRDRVRTESDRGERVAFDQVGVVSVKERTVRHQDTQYINSPHRKRWVTMKDYDVADLLDRTDVIRILNDPSGAYARAFVAAFNRRRDADILLSALGTAFTGKQGTTPVSLPVGQQIAASGTGFTLAKVEDAMQRLIGASVVDDENDIRVTIAWTSFQQKEFLQTTEVKSHDFNTQRVLVKGRMMRDDEFYGFNYINLEDWEDEDGVLHRIVPKSGTTRSCVAWVNQGVLLNEPLAPATTVDRMPGKKNSTQIFTAGTFGATRMQETMVVQIDCNEP